MAKILVTGGTGYIGSHTVVELLKSNHEVVIADNLINSSIDVLDGIEKICGKRPDFVKIDLADSKAARDLFSTHKDLDAVIHFAALKAVGESVNHPLKYYRNNIFSLINVIEGITKQGISHLIFSSSCTVYGLPDRLPVTESTPVKSANSPYGNTKQIAEEILSESCSVNKNINCISLRYFNPVGAHESALIGELPLGVPNNLLPFITQTAAGLREQLSVFGDDYDTPDGTGVRDYIHVVDLAHAHMAALDRLIAQNNDTNYEVYNVGTGNGHSVMEVIQSFEKVSGVELSYKKVARREGDIAAIYADTSFAEQKLGWKAKLNLDAMTSSAWKWEQSLRSKKG